MSELAVARKVTGLKGIFEEVLKAEVMPLWCAWGQHDWCAAVKRRSELSTGWGGPRGGTGRRRLSACPGETSGTSRAEALSLDSGLQTVRSASAL